MFQIKVASALITSARPVSWVESGRVIGVTTPLKNWWPVPVGLVGCDSVRYVNPEICPPHRNLCFL